ncbi:MAG: class I SAM-dependent methyltransferase, partial [Burkholderiaceae bacterium]
MNSTTFSPTAALRSAPAAARTALRLLERLRHGCLTVQLPDGSMKVFGEAAHAHHPRRLSASIALRNWKPCAAALRSGDVGFAESYIAGDWSTPNLTELLKLFIANRAEVEAVIYGNWAGRALLRVRHWLHRNTRANSRRNIHAHYDLGNDFYRLWLDASMNYSAAWFNGDQAGSMPAAQDAKVRRALEMVKVQPGQRVLEIGCGWGALAEMATTE